MPGGRSFFGPHMRTLTPSAIATYVSCPYRYQLRYLYKIAQIRYSPALVIGDGIHAGVEYLHSSSKFKPLPDAMMAARSAMKKELIKLKKVMDTDEFAEAYAQAQRDRAKVMAVLRAYNAVYPRQLPMIQTEGHFDPRPIVNPATGKNSKTFNLSGIFDGVYSIDSRMMLYELKSTSDSLKEASMVLSASIQPYLYLSMVEDISQFAGICIDIVKKPVTPFKRAETRSKNKANEVVTEPLDDYENRCFKSYISKPERFFRRLIFPVDPDRIRYAQEVAWRIAQEIRDSDRYGYLACRGTNCKTTNGWCEYRDLCWFSSTDNYQHGEYAHEELELVD